MGTISNFYPETWGRDFIKLFRRFFTEDLQEQLNMRLICVLIFAVLVTSKDILNCIKNSTRNRKLMIGGPNACEVKPHSKPWIVRLDNKYGCGGTLIAENAVLTAKHCDLAIGDVATLGDHDADDFDNGEMSIKVAKVISDLPFCSECDFAILILEKKVQPNKNIQIASLPSPNEEIPSGKVLVSCGWGADNFNKTRETDNLWCVAQENTNNSKCPSESIPEEYALCTTDPDDRRNSPCHGDSGGPLTHTDENGKTTLFGVVQGAGDWQFDCNRTEVFSRVSNPNVLNWIEAILDDNPVM